MGGILDHDAWRRSNGGLWLPRVFGMPETVYGWRCCGDEKPPCNCECPNCKEDPPASGKHPAPCCWKVIIAGIVATDPEQCADCDDLNDTYYLSQDPEMSCLWRSPACVCGEATITLQISENDGQYTITVTLGEHVWSKTYDEPPDCCALAAELEYVSGGTECDSSEATCSISATADADCHYHYCMEVALSGIDRYNGDCGCPSCSTLNGSWKLPIGSFSNYGSLIGTTGYGRDLCSSSEPYHRCGYAHISGSVVIESNEATTATIVVRMYGADPYAGLPDREEGGMFMQWSGTATRASEQTWEDALAAGASLSYDSQSGKGEFDCDGGSASIVVKVFPYTPECDGTCEPGSPCWSRPTTCDQWLKCYGGEWPERMTVVFDEDAFVRYLPDGKEDIWDPPPIIGATLTYHDAMEDHPIVGYLPCASWSNITGNYHAAYHCQWSYVSETFEGPGCQVIILHEVFPGYPEYGYIQEIWDIDECEWWYFISAFNRHTFPSTPGFYKDDWNIDITIVASFSWRYRYPPWDQSGVCVNIMYYRFNGPQVRPCNGDILLDCFGSVSLEYYGSLFPLVPCIVPIAYGTQEPPVPVTPWVPGSGGCTIEAG